MTGQGESPNLPRLKAQIAARIAAHIRQDEHHPSSPHWNIDAQAFLLDSENARLAGQAMIEILDDDTTCIGGPATGAVPLITAVLCHSPRHMRAFYVRPRAREHGLGQVIEGTPDHHVAVIDDTCTSGASLLHAIRAIEEDGHVVNQVAVLLDHSTGGAEAIRQAGYRYHHVLSVIEGVPLP